MFTKPNLLISRCLEFESCRWNGAMISSEIVRKLKPHVTAITPCPEKDIGLGVPRIPIRLVARDEEILLMQNETDRDVTGEMKGYLQELFASLEDIDGFILKDRSPSCGTKDVKVYPATGKVSPLPRKEPGIFGGAVLDRYAGYPIENEGRLLNFSLREHFLTHLFTRARFRTVTAAGTMKGLVDFHSDYKYLFMALNQSVLKKLGTITANREKKDPVAVIAAYGKELPTVFSRVPKKGQVINVLMHCLGYFSDGLTASEKAHFLDMLEGYRSEKLPLSACQSLLSSWAHRYGEEYLLRQVFFRPYPLELTDLKDSGN